MDRDAILDMIQNPDTLKRMFEGAPEIHGPPEQAKPQIDLPESHPLPSIECYCEIKLSVAFDPWEISGIPQDELKSIVWAMLTDPGYQGGIRPVLTYVSMTLERKHERPTSRWSLVVNAPDGPRGGVPDRAGADADARGEPEHDDGAGDDDE